MKSKEYQSKNEPKTSRIPSRQEKYSGNDLKLKTNIQKSTKLYDVQLIILEDIQKLKINLEITDNNKHKTIYFTTVSLDELISLNPFFKNFDNYSKAFDFLLKNFTKIDQTKITYLNNHKEIKIILLFSVNDIYETDTNDIEEESIEVILHNYTINNTNKSMGNINSVINNLKASLEKFSLSIKELKTNVNNDKIEKDRKIKDLENSFNMKINDIKKSKLLKNSKTYMDNEAGPEGFDGILNEIYAKMEDYNNDILALKQDIEDSNLRQKNEMNKNNKIIMEKENELSKLITEKFEDFMNKINNLDDKNIEIENNVNNKISELDMKTNICFNELIKKINNKNNNGSISENDLKIKMNGIIGKILEDNENLEKKLDIKLNKRIDDLKKELNDQINNKIKSFEERLIDIEKIKEKKINISNADNTNNNNNQINDKIKELEKKIKNYDITINNNNNDKSKTNNNDDKINEFNNLITKKFNDLEGYKKNLLDKLEKNESKINKNKLNIDDLSNQIAEIYEELYKTKPMDSKKSTIKKNNNEINNIKKEIDNIQNELKNNINLKINELTDTLQKNNIETKNTTLNKDTENNTKLNEFQKSSYYYQTENIDNINEDSNNIKEVKSIKEISDVIEELKKDIYKKINEISESKKDNEQEINSKILNIRADLLKIFDSKNNSIEKQIKTIDDKIIDFDNKINKETNKKENIIENENKPSNNDEDKFKEMEMDIKSYDLRIINIENKIKQMENIIGNKKVYDFYSTKTITSSNSNGYFTQKVKIPLYRSTLPKTTSSSKNKDNTDKKNKRPSNYNISSNPRTSITKERNAIFDLNIDSNILKKEDLSDNFFLFSKLKEIYPYNRYIKLILIYRATRDGDLSKDFHSQCDFIGPNLALVKTKKGYIFGGFTIKNWKHLYKDIKKDDPQISTEYIDDKAFGFSVNKKKIYENGIPDESIIYCNNNYGICFKNFFYIYDEAFKNGGMCGKIEETSFNGINKQYEFNGGQEKFLVEEIEIFQIGFR